MSLKDIQIIAVDADDTLWNNEHFFREAEESFADLLADYMPEHSVTRALLEIEIRNLETYGYGIKSFMLSMIETALQVSENTLPQEAIWKILDIGKDMLNKPVVLIDGVEDALQVLMQDYRLVMATKGDLRDQEKKLEKSGLAHYFHHTEVMS
jgi:putative hydrolase of the HAD superfamily